MNNFRKRLISVLLVCMCCICAFSQQSSDSIAGKLEKATEKSAAIQPTTSKESKGNQEVTKNDEARENADNKVQTVQASESKTPSVDADAVINEFVDYLDTIPYYSGNDFSSLSSDINSYVEEIQNLDEKHKKNYIAEKQLNGYLNDVRTNLKEHRDSVDVLIEEFLSRYSDVTINDRQRCKDEMKSLVLEKLKEREDVIGKLDEAIGGESFLESLAGANSMILYIGGVIIVILLLIIIIMLMKGKSSKKPTVIPSDSSRKSTNADIVVRRKTVSILKTQSLEDVIDNPAYMKIDCVDFCDDSAVRRIYLKNTCVKDIYNMYAEDLKKPDNPNEDGCMVLGRWVHDDETDEYYVSLEEIVKPGDDAIFQEYELNFGGKIKLKVRDRLRKLRHETNLQYDMTCWVHSHPGLGVFFSNADSSVQMQLKHSTHPKFLTAIVIDILTPEQELGIFTFKHDLSINAKSDLKKMYSLEEMYKWAVASDKSTFKQEDYFNIMQKAKSRLDSCNGVQLSNGAIIEMCQMATEQDSGFVAWVHGFCCKRGEKIDYVVKKVSGEKIVAGSDNMGIFLAGTYRSIPTIRKAITNAEKIQFVLFYSTSDGLLTAIPVVEGQLSQGEIYYGEEKLEDLKIWTRRRR